MGACGSKPPADTDKVLGSKIESLQATVDALAGNLHGLQQAMKTAATADDVTHIISDISALREQQLAQNLDIKDKFVSIEEQNGKLLTTTEACSDSLLESNKLHTETYTKAEELHSDIQLLHKAHLKTADQLAEIQNTHNQSSATLEEMADSINIQLTALQSQLHRFEDKGVKLAVGETTTVTESVSAVSQQASQILAELFAYQRKLDNICTTLDKVSIHASEAASFRQIDDLSSDVQSLKSKLVKPARSPAKPAPTMTGWSRVHQDMLTKTYVVLDSKSVQISARASGAIILRNWSSDRTFYNKEAGSSWVFTAPSSSKASLSFCLKDSVPYEFSLVLTHLTAYDAANNRPGHAPIRVTINDTLLVADHDVSSFDYITERWVIPPGVLLPAGWENKVVLLLGPSASSAYWLQRLEVRPNGVYGQPNVQ